jgi:hypothetical protein
MALCEGHARTRLQVPFKGHRPAFVGKLHDDINDPRSVRGRMRTVASVVRIQSRRKTRRQPCVVAAWVAGTLKNVDDALGRHVALTVQGSRPASAWTSLPGVASMRRDGAQFQRCAAREKKADSAKGRLACQPSTFAASPLRWTSFASPRTYARSVRSSFAPIQSEGWLAIRSSLCEVWRAKDGGPDRDRTGDLMNAIHARSQLRYWPTFGGEGDL